MRHPIDQTGARQIAEHRTLAVDFRALEIGSLVNIDHTTRYFKLGFASPMEGLVKSAKQQFDPLTFLEQVPLNPSCIRRE